MFLVCALVCIANGLVFLREFLFPLRDKDRLLQEFRIIFLALAMGLVLGNIAFVAQMKEPSAGIPFEKVTGLNGTLSDDPHLLVSGNGAFTFTMISSRGKDGLTASASGSIQVFFPQELFDSIKSLGRGSKLFLDGTIIPQNESRPNDSLRFSAKSIHVYADSSWLHSARTSVRLAIINSFEYKRWGGLALALLLGVRDSLNNLMTDNYKLSGCSHVLALSGMHLGIISALVAFILKKPLGLRKASILGALLIIAYVFLVGAQASLMRAAIMSVLGTFAMIRGYQRNMLSLLSAAFIMQIVLFPASALTISFILSYLALAGILLFSPMFAEFLKGWLPDIFVASLSASLAAFFATISVTGIFFGIIRPIGIVAGLFIVPVVTLFMILSIAYFFLQAVPFANELIGKVLDFIYTVLDLMVLEAGKVPGLAVSNNLVLLVVCLLSFVVLFAAYKKIRHVRMRFVPFT
ncbi:MAG: ComEC/Rec2 family competence protein [Treponema sp.]|nr:ComEC/Rec2 family competence protein [Treponema sp.]